MKIRNIFHRKRKEPDEPQPIEGAARVPMTAEPDDAELAAQALLEVMIERKASKRKTKTLSKKSGKSDETTNGKTEDTDNSQTVEYYEQLADRIRMAYDASRRRAMRFLSFCEQELQKRNIPIYGDGSIALLEAELYKRIDIVDREGGELKKRWQECIAEVTLRLMEADEKRKAEDEKRYEKEYEQHKTQA